MLKYVAALVLTSALAGCSAEESSGNDEPAVKSSPAPEESIVLITVDEDGKISRCWKNPEGYQCLSAAHIAQPRISFAAFETDAPKVQSSWDASGYSCEAYVDPNGGLALIKEYIRRGEDTLITNTFSRYNSDPLPWSKQFVTKFAADNKVAMDRQWFNCKIVASAVTEGSLQTISTTAINREDLFGE